MALTQPYITNRISADAVIFSWSCIFRSCQQKEQTILSCHKYHSCNKMNNPTSCDFITGQLLTGNMMDTFTEASDEDGDDYLDIDELGLSFEDDLEFIDCIEGEMPGRRLSLLTLKRRLSISSNANPREVYKRRNSIINFAPQPYYSDVREFYKRRKSIINFDPQPSNSDVTSTESLSSNSLCPSNMLSLLSPAELEQKLEQTKSRLAESMERSELSRQQIHSEHHVHESLDEHSHSAQASVLSQSRDHLAAAYMRVISSMTLG